MLTRWIDRLKKITTPESTNRYGGDDEIWDARVGTPLKRAANWRLFALFALCVVMVQSIINYKLFTRTKIEVHTIESVCGDDVRYLGQLGLKDWSPDLGTRQKHVWDWIENLRSVSSDENVLVKNRTALDVTSTPEARLMLEAQKDNPFELHKTMRRTIHPIAINAIEGAPNTFRVQWEERRMDDKGQIQGTDQYLGEFTIVVQQPKTREQIRLNPRGVYTSFFSFNKKLPNP